MHKTPECVRSHALSSSSSSSASHHSYSCLLQPFCAGIRFEGIPLSRSLELDRPLPHSGQIPNVIFSGHLIFSWRIMTDIISPRILKSDHALLTCHWNECLLLSLRVPSTSTTPTAALQISPKWSSLALEGQDAFPLHLDPGTHVVEFNELAFNTLDSMGRCSFAARFGDQEFRFVPE